MEITTLTASIAPFLPFLLNLDNKTAIATHIPAKIELLAIIC
jgi:hypothetical protein